MYSGRNREREIDNGFIYPIFKLVIQLLFYLNIVEMLKWTAAKTVGYLNRNFSETLISRKVRMAKNIAVDLFIVLKFIYIGFVWFFELNNNLILGVSIYLLIFNTYTYFYYHIWEEGSMKGEFQTVHRMRRRFISLLQSLLYMIFVYGYLYNVPFVEQFKLSSGESTFFSYLLFSLSKTFPFSYEGIKIVTEFGELIVFSQALMSFLFITIILAQSLPKANR
ncbi:Uncharacterised protein [Mycobacteroides abscessus subsp. abscessus]|nr:Uncharacterised protein [Mycobacteroides abscessus subsp. abscessus]